MADKETDFNISVGAVADKNSAKKAANDLTKGVLSSLKDGYIEVPAEIKAPIKNSSKELEKAQKDVIKQWKKTFKEGFSSSQEDLDNLVNAYQRFKKLAGQQHKSNTKQVKGITALMGEQLQAYTNKRQEREITKAVKKSSSRKGYIGTGAKITKEEIDANINQEIKRRLKNGIKSVLPKGFKRTLWDAGSTSDKAMYNSEFSQHPSGFARQIRISELAARKWEKESLKTWTNKKEANEFADAAIRRNPTKKQSLNASLDMMEDASKQLSSILGSIEANNPAVSIELFNDYLKGVLAFGKQGTGADWRGIETALNTVFGRYFNTTGRIGGTTGEPKGVGKGHANAQIAITGMLDIFKKVLENNGLNTELARVRKVLAKIDVDAVKDLERSLNTATASTKRRKGENSLLQREIDKLNKTEESQVRYDKIESNREAAADSKERDLAESSLSVETQDSRTGFNTDSKADELIKKIDGSAEATGEELEKSSDNIKKIPITGIGPEDAKYLKGIGKQTGESVQKAIEESGIGAISPSTSTELAKGPFGVIKNIFASMFKSSEVEDVLKKTQKELEDLRAERIKNFGLSDVERRPTGVGDKIRFGRARALFGFGKKNQYNPFEGLELTEGIHLDTTKLGRNLQKSIQKNMFKAQTGGIFGNIIGSMTGFLGQPSLEKRRAKVEAANQLLANTRQAAQESLESIKSKETDLQGLKDKGLGDSPEAYAIAAQLEDLKKGLKGIIADAEMMDFIVKSAGGNLSVALKNLSFVAPELRKNNIILQNINAGYDKSGKALKFQTRTAEILNYTFKSLARHIGRMWKNWILMLNPINLIKRAFSDFTGYSTKWQRTMNVIKYNLRTILRPFMEWLAQKLVNIIGFFDVISMKIQEGFGRMPISVFDQAAANSEKIHEELEAAANVTAGFDELHDIGSDNSGANDLLGEIYKPELSSEWQDLAEHIGNLFKRVIQGDLGFGDAMKEILKIAWKGIQLLWKKYLKPFFTKTLWPFIKDSFWELLGTIATIFFGWKFLKTVGSVIWNAITSKLTGANLSSLGTTVGSTLGVAIKKAIGRCISYRRKHTFCETRL